MTAHRTRSKKRSGGKRARRKTSPIFFVDHCLGGHSVAEVFRTAGFSVRTLAEVCDRDTDDAVWLRRAGRERWVVLTKDTKFRTRSIEIEAILDASVRAFVLSGAEGRQAQVAAFTAALPRMIRILNKQEHAFLAVVTPSGSVQVCTVPQLTRWRKLL